MGHPRIAGSPMTWLVILFCCTALTAAQNHPQDNEMVSNTGRHFLLSFLPNVEGKSVLKIAISSREAGHVNVSAPYHLFRREVKIEPYVTSVVEVPSQLRMREPEDNQGLNFRENREMKGISILSSVEVTVHAFNLAHASSDAFLVLPLHMLGMEYAIPSIQPTTSSVSLAIAAYRDNTHITFTAGPLQGKEVKLDSYGTVLISSDTDMTGTVIESTRPVAVYSGSECSKIGQLGSCDHLAEQVIPTKLWGREYVAIPLDDSMTEQLLNVIGSEDSTVITFHVSGQEFVTDKGEGVQVLVPNDSDFITCSAPCLITLFSQGRGTTIVDQTDPFMIILPAVEHYSNDYLITTTADADEEEFQNFVSLIVEKQDAEDIYVDDERLPGHMWSEVPNTVFLAGTMSISPGTHTIAHPDEKVRFGLLLHGNRTANSYGYVGGMKAAWLEEATEEATSEPEGSSEPEGTSEPEGLEETDEGKVYLPYLMSPMELEKNVPCIDGDLPSMAAEVNTSDVCKARGSTSVTSKTLDFLEERDGCKVTISQEWTITDGCGQVANETTTFIISQKPFVSLAQNMDVECEEPQEVKQLLPDPFISSCDDVQIIDLTDYSGFGTVCQHQTMTRRFVVTSPACQTSSVHNQTVLLRPTSAGEDENVPCTIQNGGCSHICTMADSQVVCRCPSGMYLSEDNSTCAGEVARGGQSVCEHNHFVVTLSKRMMAPVTADQLRMGGCRPSYNQTHFVFYSRYDECNTAVEEAGSQMVFKNTIVTVRTPVQNLITYVRNVQIDVVCYMNREQVISQNYEVRDSRMVLENQGGFDVRFGVYPGGSVTPGELTDNTEATLTQEEELYAAVEVRSPDNRLTVIAKNCYATSTPADSDQEPQEKVHFMLNGCPVDPSLVNILEYGGTQEMFSMKVFTFLDGPPVVYLHCEVVICTKNNLSCQPRCGEGMKARSRRSLGAKGGSKKLVSVGPISLRK